MAPRPKQQRNWVVLILILLVMLLVGNATGKVLGIGRKENEPSANAKKKDYGYFGLEKLWAKEKAPPPEEPWWKFWN
jgi:flagellar basal body-associated protein FliL